ncbi:MAG: DUF2142 domain-containing protein [Chloroflexi bacterium]|nr:DUF2142 domain-containing protein [Chloroflexota bacterium]
MLRAPEHSLIMALLLLYFCLGALFVVRTPAWQAPDEPAHYNYIAQLSTNGCCPVITPGDWDSAYLSALTSARFAPDLLADLDTIQYEDHQPPLYYLLLAPVFSLTDGSLMALRFVSLMIGAGVVLSAYAVGRQIFPARPQIALGTAAFVAFVPQHLVFLSAVNNDVLAELIVGLALLGMINYLRTPRPGRAALLLGLLIGIGFWTKTTVYFLAGIVPLAILLRWWLDGLGAQPRRLRPLLGAWARFLIPALLLGLIWWGRNLSVYGVPDFMGLATHDVVVADQPRTADLAAEWGLEAYLRFAAQTTFNSFWGQFGWMARPLPAWSYMLIQLLLALIIGGWLLGWTVVRRDAVQHPRERRAIWIIFAVTVALTGAQYLFFNLEFVQPQGRYLFTALIPLGVWAALGLDAWRRLLVRLRGGIDGPLLRWAALLPLGLLVALNLFVIWRELPSLAP